MARNRRDFLKSAAAGAAGVAVAGTPAIVDARGAAWSNGMQINPAIDNLRVVCCHDPDMITGWPTSWQNTRDRKAGMEAQNAPVVDERVRANMDAMAMALARKQTAAEAWATIFRKPSSKSWSQVKAAIKVNCIGVNHPRLAVVDKICRALNRVGVPFDRIVVYDGCDDAARYYSYFPGTRLPAGLQVSQKNSLLGGTARAATPAPFAGSYDCTKELADGTVDILVNIAVNKNHDQNKGGATLCLKHHFGTFTPNPNGHGTLDYIIAINKSDAIVGGTPPRQQLCMIDSLWASRSGGPMATPDNDAARLVMGTFAPAVDYLTVKKIREPVVGATHNSASVARWLTDFGYQSGDFPADFVNVDPASVAVAPRIGGWRPGATVELRVDSMPGKQGKAVHVHVGDRASGGELAIHDVSGRLVRRLSVAPGARQVVWDGRSEAGVLAGPGTYVVRCGGVEAGSRRIQIVR